MRGEYIGDSIMEDAITIAKTFWKLIAEIFNALFLDHRLVGE